MIAFVSCGDRTCIKGMICANCRCRV